MGKIKKLTLATLDKLDSEFNERKTIYILGQYQHTIAVKFRRSEIQKLMIDYFSALDELKRVENIDNESILNAGSLLNILIVKYFSDLEIPPINDLRSMIHVSRALLDLGVMSELFDHEKGFAKTEIDFLALEIKKAAKLIGEQYGEILKGMAIKNIEDSEKVSDENGNTQESE